MKAYQATDKESISFIAPQKLIRYVTLRYVKIWLSFLSMKTPGYISLYYGPFLRANIT